MPGDRESEGRNRWGTARERDRRRARREIRARVANAGANNGNDDTMIRQQVSSSSSLQPLTMQEIDIIRPLLRHVEAGKASAFSLTTLSQHYELLNHQQKLIPTTLLSSFKIKTLCTSRFGTEYATLLKKYVLEARETCTLFEYASWLGEYNLLGPMIAGGLDPTLRGQLNNNKKKKATCCSSSVVAEQCRQALSVQVLKRFFDAFPISLSSYIVKRVVDLRFQYWKKNESSCVDNDDDVCTLCGSNEALLSFEPPCLDTFCENCYWQDMLDNIDHNRNDGDVVVCPVCAATTSQTTTTDAGSTTSIVSAATEIDDSPSERCRLSLEKYQSLPANTKQLKQLPKRSNKARHRRSLSCSWSEAVSQSVGSSQDVRQDKFFNYTERDCFHFVRACLVNGVDVDATNEYGQTCLHIAAWRGYTKLVKLLLYFGADPLIRANGGVSVERSSEANGHAEIVQLLRQDNCSPDSPLTDDFVMQEKVIKANGESTSPQLEVLIDMEEDHPGAGSYLIDGGFSEQCVYSMIELWQSLPVAPCEAKKKVPKALCSVRSYFCDSQGHLCHLLADVIRNAFKAHSLPPRRVLVLPHMRFLHYDQPGGVLAPHVDLPRTDIAGNHSTHTFILYLFDCTSGGETVLLGAESGEGRHVTLARVSPLKGRLLLFPHACPHEGNEVVDVPKVLIRGEVVLPG